MVILFQTLLACAAGPQSQTLIDELRVVASVAEPPELAPDESTGLTHHVADPTGGAIVSTWTCTFAGEDCLEELLATPIAERVAQGGHADGIASSEYTASALLGQALGDDLPELPVLVWTLACEPGLCPVQDAIAADPSPGSDSYEALSQDLADPFSWLADLPKQGVSLGVKTLTVSLETEPNSNPVVQHSESPEGSGVRHILGVEDSRAESLTAYGYASWGGFETSSVDVIDGTAELVWLPPNEDDETAGTAPDTLEFWLVVSDGLGGVAVVLPGLKNE